MKFRKKPVVIEAMQFTAESKDRCFAFVTCRRWAAFDCDKDPKKDRPVLIIETLEGNIRAQVGDWIIKGTAGEFYPVKDSIFQEIYEVVDAERV